MLLGTKKLAFLGLLLALSVLTVILSGILEFNTLFLLAAGSFCIGIAIRESGIRFGFGFFVAAVLLSIMLAPNKIYCITFAAMGFYLIIAEYAYEMMVHIKKNGNRRIILWVIKYVTFNAMFIPILLLLPRLVYSGSINKGLLVVVVLAGQIVLFIYDRAYDYFQKNIWGKARVRLKF